MIGVFSGFFIVWSVILTGFFVGRTGVLGDQAQMVLSRFSFFVASPALLFLTISGADIGHLFSAPLLVALVSGTLTAISYGLVSRFALRRDGAHVVMASQAASQVNSANLGIPIALFVLGDASQAAPVLLYQLAINTPVYLTAMDTLTRGVAPSAGSVLSGMLRNPMIIGSAAGVLFSAAGWELPELLHQPVDLLAGASIPCLLFSFGLSLVGSRPLRRGSTHRVDTLLATGFKLVVHPLIAFAFARWVLGLDGFLLYSVVVMAALPTAQNVFAAAVRYERGEEICRDTVLLTTVVAMLTMAVVALLLAAD